MIFRDEERTGAFEAEKVGCCFSGVLWNARNVVCAGEALGATCRRVAATANGRLKMKAIFVVVV